MSHHVLKMSKPNMIEICYIFLTRCLLFIDVFNLFALCDLTFDIQIQQRKLKV